MTQSILLEPGHTGYEGRRRRLAIAIIATLVLLCAMAVIEAGLLAFLAVASSALNHHGPGS